MTKGSELRHEVEDFLYLEAHLLDEWNLDEWFKLFAEGATYDVPTAGSADDADSSAELFYVSDDYFRIAHRVKRLNSPRAHSEWPRSITSRIVSNVRILGENGGVIKVRSAYITHRSKEGVTDMYCGHHLYELVRVEGGFKIQSKRTMLDMENLHPQGRVSIIL